MYDCPECGNAMCWQSDNEIDEYTFSFYTCDNCNIELVKYWGDLND